MIFVTTGTEKHPFDRMVAEVDRLAAGDGFDGAEVLVQTGSSDFQPQHCRTVKLLSYGEMVEQVRAARLVIAHGGAGSFMLCRQFHTPLIMIPRLRRMGENVDDHQVLFCRRLAGLGHMQVVEEVAELGASVRRALDTPREAAGSRAGTQLAADLAELARTWFAEVPAGGPSLP